MRLTREQSQARTRMLLLDSARQLVATEGFDSASIDRIAEDAGYSKGAFYSNFASKEDLFLQLLEQHAGQDLAELETLLGDVDDPYEIIRRLSGWSDHRAVDRSNGLLVLELVARAQRDATFGDRHAKLYLPQWEGVGHLLMRLFPEGAAPSDAATLGGIFMELTYGVTATFSAGPPVGELVRVVLTGLYMAHRQSGGMAGTGADAMAGDQRPRAASAASSRG